MKFISLISASLIGSVSFAAQIDERAISFIHGANVMEIQMTQTAIARSDSQAVKAYAKTVQADHQQADQKLLAIAKAAQIEVKEFKPDSPEEKAEVDADHALMDKLATLDGARFNEAFVDGMYDGHVRAIAKIEGFEKDVTLAPLADFIADTLPVLESHRDQAAELKKTR